MFDVHFLVNPSYENIYAEASSRKSASGSGSVGTPFNSPLAVNFVRIFPLEYLAICN